MYIKNIGLESHVLFMVVETVDKRMCKLEIISVLNSLMVMFALKIFQSGNETNWTEIPPFRRIQKMLSIVVLHFWKLYNGTGNRKYESTLWSRLRNIYT